MTIPLKLVEHVLMEQPTLPPIHLPWAYINAQNGVFVWAKREGLEALIPVAPCTITGLYPVEPYVRMDYQPVDTVLVSEMIRLSREAHTPEGGYLEILFYLSWERKSRWHLTVPAQHQEAFSVRPILNDLNQQLHAEALIEVHSHHSMRAFFSGTDNRDEQGFRIYGVIGRADGQAEIRMRVGIYGHFWEIPASQVLSLPWGLRDCMGGDA